MGLLSQGHPLSWEETKKYAKFVQQRGIVQFCNIYNVAKKRQDQCLKWGDEVEYIIVKFDHENKKAKVSLNAEKIFQLIHNKHNKIKTTNNCPNSFWVPEFGAYMVESTPGTPYGDSCEDRVLTALNSVEANMKFRREELQELLDHDETIMSLTSFPRLGCPQFTHPIYEPQPRTSASGSLFFPDEAIFGGHPRFKTLVKNIRARRKRKVIINLPIFKDKNTTIPFVEHFDDDEAKVAAKPDHIYMDAMGFGMGCCCLQMTFQASHMDEAKLLYDQLAPFCPIAMALSAASPVYRGYLTDRDCRWEVISCAVDDRTREESSKVKEPNRQTYQISKSRYDSIDSYISTYGEKFNDLPLTLDESYYEFMTKNGVDNLVARHIAHLFIREPITLYEEKLEQRDDEFDHFENIQSTNWQTMRFKPPPSASSSIGWRVEFRPLEAQTTDFENAAYVVFIALLTRLILSYRLDLLIPISMVDENMVKAQERDAVSKSKFWFRKDIIKCCSKKNLTKLGNTNNSISQDNSNTTKSPNCIYNTNGVDIDIEETLTKKEQCNPKSLTTLMSINEIINGSDEFPGLVPLLRQYLSSVEIDPGTLCTIEKYLKLISDRASLKVKTTAKWIREFIDQHPKYNHDSIVNDEINYDLLHKMDQISKQKIDCPELTGCFGASSKQN